MNLRRIVPITVVFMLCAFVSTVFADAYTLVVNGKKKPPKVLWLSESPDILVYRAFDNHYNQLNDQQLSDTRARRAHGDTSARVRLVAVIPVKMSVNGIPNGDASVGTIEADYSGSDPQRIDDNASEITGAVHIHYHAPAKPLENVKITIQVDNIDGSHNEVSWTFDVVPKEYEYQYASTQSWICDPSDDHLTVDSCGVIQRTDVKFHLDRGDGSQEPTVVLDGDPQLNLDKHFDGKPCHDEIYTMEREWGKPMKFYAFVGKYNTAKHSLDLQISYKDPDRPGYTLKEIHTGKEALKVPVEWWSSSEMKPEIPNKELLKAERYVKDEDITFGPAKHKWAWRIFGKG